MRRRGHVVLVLLVMSSLSARAQEHVEVPARDPKGDLGLTLLGGLGGTLVATGVVAGAAYWTVSCQRDAPGSDCVVNRMAYALFPAMAAVPVLISAGVVLAANETGGKGYFMATALGLLGFAPGIAVLAVAQTPAMNRFGVGLMAAGYLTGAVIGYRWSAGEAPQTSIALSPTPDGAAITMTGAF